MNGRDLLIGLGDISQKYYEEAENEKIQKKARTFRGTFSKVLIAAAILSTLTVTVSAAGLGWFRRYFEKRSDAPLSQAEVEFIEHIEQPINEAMTKTLEPVGEAKSQNGYTLEVKSAMTDGYMAYITIGITGPEDAVLSKTVIPGYDPSAPGICAENFMKLSFFKPAEGNAKFGYCSMGAVEDGDGLDNTQDLLLTVEAEMENGEQPFAPDRVWKLCIKNLTATYSDLEAQKALDEKYGGEYCVFTGEEGLDPYPEVVLAEGAWDYDIRFTDTGARSAQLISTPVTASVLICGRIDEPDTWQEVPITSFVLNALSATVEMDTDSIPELQDYKNGKYVYAVMKDGSQVELETRSSDGPGRLKLAAARPIDLDQVDHVRLADGTKLPMP